MIRNYATVGSQAESTVTKFRVGDQVTGSAGPTLGAHAEHLGAVVTGVCSTAHLNLTTVPSLPILMWILVTHIFGKTRAGIAFTGLRGAKAMALDVKFISHLAASGHYVPVIDRTYSLKEAASAHARVEAGHKKGSVVLTLHDPGE